MERHTVFMDLKIQHSKDVNSAQVDTGLTQSLTKALYFVDTDKIILKFLCKGKGTRIAKNILKKKVRFTLTDFKTYYRAIVWYWQRERHIDRWKEQRTQK